MFWFFLYAQGLVRCIELHYAIPFGIIHPIAENSRFSLLGIRYGTTQHLGKSLTVKYIIAQHQTYSIFSDEILPDQKSLSQSVRRRLFGIFKTNSEL